LDRALIETRTKQPKIILSALKLVACDNFERGDPSPALRWVRKENETEIRAIFKQVQAARGEGDAAKAVAERFFFETLVRIHRAGEGEPFTGLKPASAIDPGLLAADKALQQGSVKELAQQMEGIHSLRGRHPPPRHARSVASAP